VINLVYGFEPHVPVDFFQFATKVELVSAAGCLLITLLPLTSEDRTAVFRTLGGGGLISVPALATAAGQCVVAGAMLLVGGALLAYKTGMGASGRLT
jgi:hypothetical protein